MIKPVMAVLLLTVMSWTASPVIAATSGARARLDHFVKGLTSLSADFKQTLHNANDQQEQVSYGKVALAAPRQFRWQTTKPYKQLIVADGERIWLYEPDLDQVTVRYQGDAESKSPLTLLTDLSRLDKEFTSSDGGERKGLLWLHLVPKKDDASFDYVELGFDKKGFCAMAFKDQLGNLTTTWFTHLERNTKLPPSTFEFAPPKDTDIIGEAANRVKITPLENGH